MKISFVVPIYKKKKEQLIACLKSLQGMSYKDIEVIGVFDGPNKELQDAFSPFEKDKRFSSLVIEHGGAPKARNAGLDAATGDLISFWDADCYAEPEMAMVWIETFKDKPKADFVYSGYKWTNENIAGFESEIFDPWTLTKYNYIASMFPIKKEKCPRWDEELTGLQDWDFWRRAVESGCVGQFIPGFGFSTDLPDKESISGNYEKTKERIQKVRAKFFDEKKDILVFGSLYKREAINIAKILDADYFWNSFWRIDDYKTVLMVGFHSWELKDAASLFQLISKDTKKCIYWMGLDAEAYYNAPYFQVKQLLKQIKDNVSINYCDGKRTKDILDDMGIESTVLPFPMEEGDPVTSIPEDFKVLALSDDRNKPLLQSIIKALPDIHFDIVAHHVKYDINEYTLGIQLTDYPRLLLANQKLLQNGRYLISNIQEPYSGYIDPSNVTKFKEEAIARILEIKEMKKINQEAKDYYLQLGDREKFKKEITSTLAGGLTIQ